MKKLLVMLLLLGSMSAHAKQKEDIPVSDFMKYNVDDFDGVADGKADFKAAALNIMANFGLNKDGSIGQFTIIDCPGMSKQDIYAQARIWLEDFCANDKKSEIRLDPASGTTLIARKRLRNVASSKEFFKLYKGAKKHLQGRTINLLVNIRIDVKDEKCRLETTIEDYGIIEPAKTGVGGSSLIGNIVGNALSVALTKERQWEPQYNYPFREKYEPIPGEKKKSLMARNGMTQKQYFKSCIPTAALAYVTSFFITQIIHDKVVDSMTSAPSYNDGSNQNDW